MYNKINQIKYPIYNIMKYQIQTSKYFSVSNNPQNSMNLNMINKTLIVMNEINSNMVIAGIKGQMNKNIIHQIVMNKQIPQNMVNNQIINQIGAYGQMGQKITMKQNMGIFGLNNKIELNVINENIGIGDANGLIPNNIMKNKFINKIGTKVKINQNIEKNQNMGIGFINGQMTQKMMIQNMNNKNNNQMKKKNIIGNAKMNPIILDQKMKINNMNNNINNINNKNNQIHIILNKNNPQKVGNELQSPKDNENIMKKEEKTLSYLEIDIMSNKFPQPLNKLGNNVIYYDPNFSKRPSEIFKDAEKFKVKTNGAFILVMNKDSLFLVLREIEMLNTNCKFDLICAGNSSKEIFEFIQKYNFSSIFKRCCLFTYHPENYINLKKIYPLIKGVFYTQGEVLNFLKEASQSTPILRTLQLMTLKDYNEYGKHLHKLIAKHYNNFSKSNYLEAIEKVKNFMDNPDEYKFRILNKKGARENQIETMLETLKLYEDIENNYEKIIKNYTSECGSVYKDFNYLLLRLNEKGIDAFGYFIAGLIYSLNKFNKLTSNGEKSNRNLYRGMRLDMIEILNYKRYEGSILCFPSFTSSSKVLPAAANRYGGRNTSVPTREGEGLFSVVLEINHNFKMGAVPNTSNIESLSTFKTESECLIHPFSFFKVKKVDIKLERYECDIQIENYSRKLIIEEKIKDGYELDFKNDYISI